MASTRRPRRPWRSARSTIAARLRRSARPSGRHRCPVVGRRRGVARARLSRRPACRAVTKIHECLQPQSYDARVSTRTRAWTSPRGSPLFASPNNKPRARRPTDVALAITSLVVLVLAGSLSHIGADLDVALLDLLGSFPTFLDAMWRAAVLAAGAWAVFLVAAALVRGRLSLARDIVASTVAAVVVAVLAGTLAGDDAWYVVTDLADIDGPPGFPRPPDGRHRGDLVGVAPPHPALPPPRPMVDRRPVRRHDVPRRDVRLGRHRGDRHRAPRIGGRAPPRRLSRRSSGRRRGSGSPSSSSGSVSRTCGR